uniref:uncharacterized protein LOC122601306 n=1 Tax=Erigeron canadensis TaxID=72917 RepID=UPI001CB96D6E|nr:uncharacterized protein LOC122601306 [Erigeron canadensis]
MADLEKRGFLWCQGPMQTGKAKVSWKALCVPKYEGGLGLRKDHKKDTLVWKIAHEDKPFSSSMVWDTIRSREQPVDWVKAVWKLLTQDRILQWPQSRRKNMNMMCCSLCKADFDSGSNLFFDCSYSSQVWDVVKSDVNMSSTSGSWNNITAWLIAHAKSRSIIHIIGRLVVAATTYFIWQEINNRMFANHASPPDILSNLIKDIVRSRLWRLKFKKTARVVTTLDAWKVGGDYLLQHDELT